MCCAYSELSPGTIQRYGVTQLLLQSTEWHYIGEASRICGKRPVLYACLRVELESRLTLHRFRCEGPSDALQPIDSQYKCTRKIELAQTLNMSFSPPQSTER